MMKRECVLRYISIMKLLCAFIFIVRKSYVIGKGIFNYSENDSP
jgi:hypothetical protein